MSTEEDKVNSGALGTLIALLAIAVLSTALALTALVRDEQTEGEIQPETAGAYAALQQSQHGELTKPAAWVNQAEGVVSMPVDRAMSVVTAKLKENPEWATPAAPVDAGTDAAATSADGGVLADGDGGATPGDDAGAGEETEEPEEPPTPEAPAPKAPEAPDPQPKAPQTPGPKAPAPGPTAPQPPAPKAPQPKPPGGSAPTQPDDGNPY